MRVLISGAGIAGPTLAWFLARAGAHITILEKSKALYPHGQNVDIQGSAVTAIKKMGLLDEVRRRNTKETGTQFINPNGKSFASFPVTEGVAASLTSEFEILRGDLAAILYDATKHHPNVDYKFDTTIENVLSNDNDSVKVELSNGEKQVYDLLVAADGQWSRVRKQCFPPESVKAKHMGMYAVYYTVPRVPSDNDMWNIYVALKSRVITTRPDPYGKTSEERNCTCAINLRTFRDYPCDVYIHASHCYGGKGVARSRQEGQEDAGRASSARIWRRRMAVTEALRRHGPGSGLLFPCD
jgi:2-polyprenyl-6-methoxyphenol hydroxylase-like FAD-dependent oxidoreductase